MKTEFMNRVSRSFYKVGYKFKKHSPEILAAVGVVGTVGTVVLACKATLKVNDILDEAKETIDKIHDSVEQEKKTRDGEVYTQEIATKDLTIAYVQTGWKFVKLYAPAAVLGVASVSCMLGSNVILRKRLALATTAYAAMETGFKEYRGRVAERFGKELDRELFYNIKAQEIEETVTDEDGNESVVKSIVPVIDGKPKYSMYSIVFDEGCKYWVKNAEYNKAFILGVQDDLNFRLKQRGIVTLNDAYDMLGIDRTQMGQFAGWVYTEDGSAGDNHIDFGLFDVHNQKACDFLNGRERSVIIDFNCIGNVLDYM